MEQNNFKRGPQSVPALGSFRDTRCFNEDLSDYDAGFKSGSKGLNMDSSKTPAWRSGWRDAQEFGVHFSWTA